MSEKKDNSIKRRDFIVGSAVGVAAVTMPATSCSKPAPAKPHRYIDGALCIGCGQCVPLCPMGAISLGAELSSINPVECSECGVCQRSRICPAKAIKPGGLEWPRTLRETFSNPLAEHKETKVAGRGTEGIKTNDTINRYKPGIMGVFIELGRPVLGTRFTDVERVVKKFKANGFDVISDNPVASLIADKNTGALKPEILNEKCISVLVEFILPNTAALKLQTMLDELNSEVETVFNVSVGLRAKPDGTSLLDDLFSPEVFRLPNGKVNLGMAQDIAGKEG